MMEYRVRSRIHPDELEEKKGKILTDGDYNILLKGPVKLAKPDGAPLATYLPGAMKDESRVDPAMFPAMYDVLHSLKSQQTDNRWLASGASRPKVKDGEWRRRTTPVSSAIVGAIDPGGAYRYCRLTAWSGKEWDQYASLFPMFRTIAARFAEEVPDRYAAQMAFIQKTHPDWVIADTPFTTITVNNSYPTGVHTDSGDLDAGFSNLIVMRRGDYRGGVFVFPEYRIGVDMQDGDLLLMDAHEWHGNTALYCNVCNGRIGPGGAPSRDARPGWGPENVRVSGSDDHDVRCGVERISIVCYYRTRMADCGSSEEEAQRATAWADRRADVAAEKNTILAEMAAETRG